ncbi:hypothetical protein A3K63_02695 [Candidatus Micrarchaeota archaeon RBG_16_49_10]|nr:MAG: hypothetical protein A3K63_02695 [Candidatus Micrarchaeota archaeon RBG_16_49_10]
MAVLLPMLVCGFLIWRMSHALLEPTGPYVVGKAEYHLVFENQPETFTDDPNDVRELMLTVYYPSDNAGSAKRSSYTEDLKGERLEGFPLALFSGVRTHSFYGLPVSDREENYPVVIFMHGGGSLGMLHTTTLEDLASHGYIVASIAYPYHDNVVVFPDGRKVYANEKGSPFLKVPDKFFEPGFTIEEMVDYMNAAEDESTDALATAPSLVLDELDFMNSNDSLLKGKLDLSEAGAFGHSWGGGQVAEALYLDDRFKAAINLDGIMFGNTRVSNVEKPYMYMLAENPWLPVTELDEVMMKASGDTGKYEEYIAEIDENIQRFYEHAKPGYLLLLEESTHTTFVSDGELFIGTLPNFIKKGMIGSLDPERAVETIDVYVVGFFDLYLKGKDAKLLEDLSINYPEATLNIFGGS